MKSPRCFSRGQLSASRSNLGKECGASITWMAAGEASVDICSLLGLGRPVSSERFWLVGARRQVAGSKCGLLEGGLGGGVSV